MPAAHAALLELFIDHAKLPRAEFQAKREGTDICGDEVSLAQAQLVDGIMYIPIGGPMGRGLGKFEKGAGAIDMQDVMDEIYAFEHDPNARGAILDIDSPGGTFSGTPELAAAVMRARDAGKPVMAFTNGMMCSAAYWVGCAATAVWATPSADVGSIGVYSYLVDRSKQFEAAGLRPEVISSGQFKGMMAPGVPLTKEHRAHLQERIFEMAEMFYEHVESMRGSSVNRADMQGQVFKARGAAERGLIDGVVSDISEVAAML